MLEKAIERKLYKSIKERGGMALKFVSPTMTGIPDRMALMPGGCIAFIELKAPGKPLRPIQEKRKRQLESLGFRVFKIDRPEQIGGVVDEIQSP